MCVCVIAHMPYFLASCVLYAFARSAGYPPCRHPAAAFSPPQVLGRSLIVSYQVGPGSTGAHGASRTLASRRCLSVSSPLRYCARHHARPSCPARLAMRMATVMRPTPLRHAVHPRPLLHPSPLLLPGAAAAGCVYNDRGRQHLLLAAAGPHPSHDGEDARGTALQNPNNQKPRVSGTPRWSHGTPRALFAFSATPHPLPHCSLHRLHACTASLSPFRHLPRSSCRWPRSA